MSNQAITWAYEQDIEPSAAKFILVTLANFASEDGYCFPSQERLARDTGQSERAVRGHLARLEELGILERDRRVDKLGHRASDGFWLVGFRPRADERPVRPPAESAGRKRAQPADSVIPTGNERQSLPAESAGSIKDEPSGEPSEEPVAAARAHEPVIALSDDEREVAVILAGTSGMGMVPLAEIGRHLREVLRARGSPLSPAALRLDALQFRDHWNAERERDPPEVEWRWWRKRMTSWFSRTKDIEHDTRDQPGPVSDSPGSGRDGGPSPYDRFINGGDAAHRRDLRIVPRPAGREAG